MSTAKLKAALEAVFDKTLTPQQIQRVAIAFYTPQEGQTNNEVAEIVLNKIRRRIVAVVRQSEAGAAASAARSAAEAAVDDALLLEQEPQA